MSGTGSLLLEARFYWGRSCSLARSAVLTEASTFLPSACCAGTSLRHTWQMGELDVPPACTRADETLRRVACWSRGPRNATGKPVLVSGIARLASAERRTQIRNLLRLASAHLAGTEGRAIVIRTNWTQYDMQRSVELAEGPTALLYPAASPQAYASAWRHRWSDRMTVHLPSPAGDCNRHSGYLARDARDRVSAAGRIRTQTARLPMDLSSFRICPAGVVLVYDDGNSDDWVARSSAPVTLPGSFTPDARYGPSRQIAPSCREPGEQCRGASALLADHRERKAQSEIRSGSLSGAALLEWALSSNGIPCPQRACTSGVTVNADALLLGCPTRPKK